MIWHLHIEADGVKLSDVDDVQHIVVTTPVPRLRHPTIVTHHDVFRIVRIDPHGVMIDVNADGRITNGLAAVVGDLHRRGRPVHTIGVLRIDANLRVIERARVLGIRARPRRAAILTPIETTE